MQIENNSFASSIAKALAKRVRELMTRNGVVERKQVAELSRILNLSPSAAHRKLNGESSWDVDQIHVVAVRFGETSVTLLSSALVDTLSGDEEPTSSEDGAYPAVLTIGGQEMRCLAWIDQPRSQGNAAAPLVAAQRAGTWHIVNAADTNEHETIYEISKIEIYPREVGKRSIAVIDDDVNMASLISEYLNEVGDFNATALFSITSAAEAMQKSTFDAYILDWFVGRGTSEELLKSIRASGNPDAPIILLTGQISTGKVADQEIAEIMRKYRIFSYLEKPVRLPILVVELAKVLQIN